MNTAWSNVAAAAHRTARTLLRPPRPKRATVVIGSAPGDQHSMPLAILGDIIRGQGLAVVDLGANTPAESFVESVRKHDDVIAVAIGVGSDEIVDAATQTAALLHEQVPGIRVFIGGPAVRSEAEARALGADEYGATALDVANRCVSSRPAESDAPARHVCAGQRRWTAQVIAISDTRATPLRRARRASTARSRWSR